MHPETRYARNGDIHLAYQVFGEGDIDILWMPGWVWQIEHIWEEPRARRMFDRLAQIGRVIIFDRRGFGLSERVPDVPTLEEQIDDALTVLDTVGARSVAVLSSTDTAPVSLMFAASQPARVEALVLFSPIASHVQTEDIPWATSPERRAKAYQRHAETWGTGAYASMFAPSLASDERIRRWFGTLERLSATPSVLQRVIRASSEIDIRASLGAIRTPTLILNRRDDKVVNPNHARYLAERIPSAKHVELPGTDTLLLAGDIDRAFDEIQEFLTGAPPVREVERTLATVLFTDIVDSTRRAAELGDRRWRALLEEHDARIRRQLAAHRGREIKTIGDGFLATFDGPARAIRSALRIRDDVNALGVDVRAGIHTGEIELRDDDIGGIAVSIGARVGSRAEPNEVLVSQTVKDLVVGSGLEFIDRGSHALKGVPGEWRLFKVDA
jgi:class 3 adenylate cyclase